MASNYPSSLPVKDAAGANLSSNPHSALHDDMYDDIVAIATELGTLPKGTAASVKARLDALPRGVVGYATTVTRQLTITTETDVTGLSVTFTAVAGRLYRTTVSVPLSPTASTTFARVSLSDGADTRIVSRDVFGEGESTVPSLPVTFPYVWTGSGSTTQKVRASVFAGAGSVGIYADLNAQGSIVIEDIGVA